MHLYETDGYSDVGVSAVDAEVKGVAPGKGARLMRATIVGVLSYLLASCASTLPNTRRLGNEVFVLTEPQRTQLAAPQLGITVPKGFITDLASVPHFLEFIESRSGPTMAAGIVHDYLYWDQHCKREEADAVLLLELRDAGVTRVRRWAIYGVIRSVGQIAFDKNTNAKLGGDLRFVSDAYLSQSRNDIVFGNRSLQDVQNEIRSKGGLTDYVYPDVGGMKTACTSALKEVSSSGFFS